MKNTFNYGNMSRTNTGSMVTVHTGIGVQTIGTQRGATIVNDFSDAGMRTTVRTAGQAKTAAVVHAKPGKKITVSVDGNSGRGKSVTLEADGTVLVDGKKLGGSGAAWRVSFSGDVGTVTGVVGSIVINGSVTGSVAVKEGSVRVGRNIDGSVTVDSGSVTVAGDIKGKVAGSCVVTAGKRAAAAAAPRPKRARTEARTSGYDDDDAAKKDDDDEDDDDDSSDESWSESSASSSSSEEDDDDDDDGGAAAGDDDE
jgi:hypothetical protein